MNYGYFDYNSVQLFQAVLGPASKNALQFPRLINISRGIIFGPLISYDNQTKNRKMGRGAGSTASGRARLSDSGKQLAIRKGRNRFGSKKGKYPRVCGG